MEFPFKVVTHTGQDEYPAGQVLKVTGESGDCYLVEDGPAGSETVPIKKSHVKLYKDPNAPDDYGWSYGGGGK